MIRLKSPPFGHADYEVSAAEAAFLSLEPRTAGE